MRRCKTCKALGIGPHAVKLWPFEDALYCATDFKDALAWDEQRPAVTGGVQHMLTTDEAITLIRRWGRKPAVVRTSNWLPYIQDMCDMAEWAMRVGDRRTFVHYFARAMYAWTLKEIR